MCGGIQLRVDNSSLILIQLQPYKEFDAFLISIYLLRNCLQSNEDRVQLHFIELIPNIQFVNQIEIIFNPILSQFKVIHIIQFQIYCYTKRLPKCFAYYSLLKK